MAASLRDAAKKEPYPQIGQDAAEGEDGSPSEKKLHEQAVKQIATRQFPVKRATTRQRQADCGPLGEQLLTRPRKKARTSHTREPCRAIKKKRKQCCRASGSKGRHGLL